MSTELRRAALVLHGLTTGDRDWTLAQLPRQHAADLRVLLDELSQLGVPADAQLLRSAIDRRKQADERLSRASAQDVYALLRKEPDRLIAVVLSGAAWSWRPALLELLGPSRAQRIRELGVNQTVGAALRRSVLEELSRRLAQRSVAPGRPSSRWGALRHWHRRWTAWIR